MKLPFEALKHGFIDFNQFAFWYGQDFENELKVTCEHLKHRFLDSPKSQFGLVKK